MFDHLAMMGEEIDLPGDLPYREWHMVLYKNPHGFIVATYAWLEPKEFITIDDDALEFLEPAGEC